jgi:thiamine-phosphate pyrophosphorylase
MLLYYITDRKSFAGTESEQRAALSRRIADAASAEIDFIQLREKDLATNDLEQLAREAVTIVHEISAVTKLLINARADVALAVGADGVHLPSGSPPVSEIRTNWLRHMKSAPLVGISAHSVEDVRKPDSQGATFAVLAPIFEKVASGAIGIGLDGLHDACSQSPIPVLALGGVNLTNARACLVAGAAGVAGIRLFQDGDVSSTVYALRELARQNASATD